MNAQKVTWKNLRENWVIFAMLAPTLIGIAVFSYIPAVQAVRRSFYNWDGTSVEELTGLENLRRLLGDLRLWTPLLLGAVLSGLSALVNGERLRRTLRSGGALALLWAFGALAFDASRFFSGTSKGAMAEVRGGLLQVLGLLALGVTCAVAAHRLGEGRRRAGARLGVYLFPILAAIVYLIRVRQFGDSLLWGSFRLIFILIVANLFKMWPSIFTAVCIHRLRSERTQYLYRVLFVVPMIIPQMVGLLIWKFFYDPNVGVLNRFLVITHLDRFLMWLDKWVLHLGVFVAPFKPAWLGDPSLIIPALIFWGFPWVGVIGVLIYLAGLQNISQDVYEAAEIDGIGWWGKFWRIELPLIMTQVRLNLILMIIGTFQAYGFQYVLLGAEGGPQNKGLTPGLYMFYQAFEEQNYGYACAIGLILFFIILVLTVINQKYVRVEK